MTKLIVGQNDLAKVNPDLAAEWHPSKNGSLLPSQITAGSNRKVWWLGKCGHEWQAVVSSRTRGNGCPFCANKRVLPGFNDLATTYPEIAEEWNYKRNGALSPEDFTYGSERKVWWICPVCGGSFLKSVNTRTATRTRNLQHCPYCPTRKGEASRKPVICLETGKTYPSAETAAAEVSRTGGAISAACRKGTKSAGFHWKYASEYDN